MFRLAGLAGLSLLAVGMASAQNHAQRSQDLRAGVLLLDSMQTPTPPTGNQLTNATPHVWYMLDSYRSVKPAGWNLYNPVAPSQVTDAIRSRWQSLSTVVGGGAPGLGEQITKRHAAYWEVRLSTASDSQLSQYNVLLVNASGYTSLNTAEREKLRQFVDRGGLLWIEGYQANQADNAGNNFPLPFGIQGGGGGATNADLFHPLLTTPYRLNLSSLNFVNAGATTFIGQAVVPASLLPIMGTVPEAWYDLKTVVASGNQPTVMVGRLGDGFILVTSRGAAAKLNQIRTGAGYNTNVGYYSGSPAYDRQHEAVAKMIINMINLASDFPQSSGGSRKSNGSPIDITAPLLKRFEAEVPNLDPGARNYFPPAIFKNVVAVTTNSALLVYDNDPKKDLDGDGNSDDGVPDYGLGNDVDLLWAANLGGPNSSPAMYEVPNPGAGVPRDQVAIVDGGGTLRVFDLFQVNAQGKINPTLAATPAYSVAAPPIGGATTVDTSSAGHGPFAPTYHEGYLYVSDSQQGLTTRHGRVWMVDPGQGALMNSVGPWFVGGSTATVMNEISGSPTVGYIPIADNSGGLDRVVYLPTRPGGGFSSIPAGVTSIWAGARGESPPPNSVTQVGAILSVATRASRQGLYVYMPGGPSPLGIKLTVIDDSGNPLTDTAMDAMFTGAVSQGTAGVLDFVLEPAVTFPPNYSVRIDYTIDWGRGALLSQATVRGNLFFPDITTGGEQKRVIGNLALSPRGTLYAVVSTQNFGAVEQGGSFYMLKEEGRGGFRIVSRYELYPQHNVALSQVGSNQVPETLTDTDDLTNLPGPPSAFLAGRFTQLVFSGGPAVLGDTVYVTARGRKGNPFVPFTIVMAFKAEPETPEINVGAIGSNFQLLQPDISRSPDKTNPILLPIDQRTYTYEQRPGADNGTVRFNKLSSQDRGPVQQAVSLSQPVVLRRAGSPDQLIYPDRNGRWSPLLWHCVFHGVDNLGAPLVTGETLFIPGASALPNILDAGTFDTVGVVMGMNSQIPVTDPYTRPDAARPWLRQVWQLKATGPGTISPNPNIRWPQVVGVQSFNDYAVRLRSTTMPGTTRAIGVVGGDGALFAWGARSAGFPNDRVFGFSRADFLVADEGRLARFDSAGNPIWTSDVTLTTGTDGDGGSAGVIKDLVRPTRAYPYSSNEIVLVDPGSNRVARIDMSGRELRSISSFLVDTAHVPEGFTPGAPKGLNNPRDVIVFTQVRQPTAAEVSAPQAWEYWIHYVIADAGNRRLVELIDRYSYNPANRQIGDVIRIGNQEQLGVLYWHSPALYSGKKFDYNALARAYYQDPINPANSRFYYVAGFGGTSPSRTDIGLDTPITATNRESGAGNGGVIVFDPNNAANNIEINEIYIPATNANVFFDTTTNDFTSAARPARMKRLGNLSSVTVKNIPTASGGTEFAVMLTDNSGVYEVVRRETAVGSGVFRWETRWMLPNEVYRYMRKNVLGPTVISGVNPMDLRATYARRLDSGEVLVANAYYGKTRSGADFNGEIVQVDGGNLTGPGPLTFGFNLTNLGFNSASVRFELPPIQGVRGIVLPVFADRR